MILQVGVKALMRNKDGKYLLLKRSVEKYKNTNGEWDIPGGRIEPGTKQFENLKREIKEETGLELVEVPRLIKAQDIFAKSGKTGEEKHVVRLTYVGEIEGEPVLNEENTDFIWLAYEKLKSFEGLDPYLQEVVNGL